MPDITLGDRPETISMLLIRGDHFTPEIIWEVDGSLVDLTGYGAELRGVEKLGDATLILDWSTANGKIVLNGTPGKIQFNVADTEVMTIIPDEGWYDFTIIDSLGIKKTKFRGPFTVEDQV